MSNNKKFNPEVLGFYAIVIVLVVIATLSLVEGGKWVYDKITNDPDHTTETQYGPFYEYIGQDISTISYSGIFTATDFEYYVITIDLDDDYNCESCGDFEEDILALFEAYVSDENRDAENKLPIYVLDLNQDDNDDILGTVNNGTITSFDNPDNPAYKQLKIDEEYPISIMYIQDGKKEVEINNSPSALQSKLDYLTDTYYFYECEEDCEDTETTSYNTITYKPTGLILNKRAA